MATNINFNSILGITKNSIVINKSSLDPDAQAFITAAGITNPTQQTAINTLVVSLKADGLWTKMKAIYPFVGGDATSHKFNLKNPLDTNAAFRLVFNGGWTHSANGALPNGTNAYADTFLNSLSNLTKNSTHLSTYIRNNPVFGTNYDIGNSTGIFANFNSTYLITGYSSNLAYFGIADESYATNIATTNSIGFWNGTTNGSTTQKIFKNGTLIKTGTAGTGNLANNSLYIAAVNTGSGANYFSNKQTAFASIGDGLTDTDAANLYTRVQAFQTSLGRQI